MVPPLPPALGGTCFELNDPRTGRITGYGKLPEGGAASGPPLLLVHSISAASTAFDLHTVYDHYGKTRPTYAFDMPGFGRSDRGPGPYTPRLMTDAVHVMTAEIRRRHEGMAIDVLGLSLSSEFAARAANEDAAAYRSVALVSPTGFTGTRRRTGPPGSTRAVPGLHAIVSCSLWADALFDFLTRPNIVRYYLTKTWGSPHIDEALWAYDVLTARQPGAKHAPLYFLSAHLFSNDVNTLYDKLEMPVWMAHGIRGDFVDYRGAEAMKSRPNWSFEVFPTGALPHLEIPHAFIAAYDEFLAERCAPPS